MPPRRQLNVPRPARRDDDGGGSCGDGDVGRVVPLERRGAVLVHDGPPAAAALQPAPDAAQRKRAQPARRGGRHVRYGSDGRDGSS